jgi:hypothetical protein
MKLQNLLLLIVYVMVFIIIKDICTRLETYTFTTQSPLPNVLIVAGVHGNEQAGSEAALKLIAELEEGKINLKRGTLTIVPTANPCGKKLGIRFQPHQMMIMNSIDLNRAFPKKLGREAGCDMSKQIADMASQNDFIIDLHEGYSFNHIDSESMGSCVFPEGVLAKRLATKAVAELNETITQKPDRSKFNNMSLSDFKFQVRTDWTKIPGTLQGYAAASGKDYILIETTGQDDIQEMPVRVHQHAFLAKSILRQLDML